jgi:hypothetical protein
MCRALSLNKSVSELLCSGRRKQNPQCKRYNIYNKKCDQHTRMRTQARKQRTSHQMSLEPSLRPAMYA